MLRGFVGDIQSPFAFGGSLAYREFLACRPPIAFRPHAGAQAQANTYCRPTDHNRLCFQRPAYAHDHKPFRPKALAPILISRDFEL
jgi:hypothetical protein